MNDFNKKEYPSVREMSDDQRIGIVKDILLPLLISMIF